MADAKDKYSSMSYNDEEFIQVVKESYSIAEVLKKLNKIPSGGNYKIVKHNVQRLGLNTTHFTGQGHLKNKTHNWSKKLTDEEVFSFNSKHNLSTIRIKQKLIAKGIVEKKCYNCNNTTWLSREIPLELEHKNGDNKDNRIENLTLLCPNCHAMTKTYRGKNKKRSSGEMADAKDLK